MHYSERPRWQKEEIKSSREENLTEKGRLGKGPLLLPTPACGFRRICKHSLKKLEHGGWRLVFESKEKEHKKKKKYWNGGRNRRTLSWDCRETEKRNYRESERGEFAQKRFFFASQKRQRFSFPIPSIFFTAEDTERKDAATGLSRVANGAGLKSVLAKDHKFFFFFFLKERVFFFFYPHGKGFFFFNLILKKKRWRIRSLNPTTKYDRTLFIIRTTMELKQTWDVIFVFSFSFCFNVVGWEE